MKCIARYMRPFAKSVIFALSIKFLGTFLEFLLPYVLEHLLDDVVPSRELSAVLLWGAVMLGIALAVALLNIKANRTAVGVARNSTLALRRDLFEKTLTLSGRQADSFGLPSLTSRMTSDSYNVQNFIRSIQTVGVRAPILLLGGIIVTLLMDPGLSAILLIIVPFVLAAVIFISVRGVPLYEQVQQAVDRIVRILRENITGIRVVKALSREDHESARFEAANRDLFRRDTKASVIMALPGPITTLFLNLGLTFVVILGAHRVNSGLTKPGVILAFLTYFNMILNGVRGLNRIFTMLSKANASAKRIDAVLQEGQDLQTVYAEAAPEAPGAPALAFDHVSFSYQAGRPVSASEPDVNELTDISFTVPKGSSLGIIGATGSGKTTIINLLMRFYDAGSGTVSVAGRDVRSYSLKALRSKFGVVFQNDIIFADTLRENISFGRSVSDERVLQACEDAMAGSFVRELEDGIDTAAQIRGANFSGGQKQRLMIARALAARPEILVLDDASSALDYKTDALLRQTLRASYNSTTAVIVAQRISSVMNLDKILVLEEGRVTGCGTHAELLASCPLYREMYRVQMT